MGERQIAMTVTLLVSVALSSPALAMRSQVHAACGVAAAMVEASPEKIAFLRFVNSMEPRLQDLYTELSQAGYTFQPEGGMKYWSSFDARGNKIAYRETPDLLLDQTYFRYSFSKAEPLPEEAPPPRARPPGIPDRGARPILT